MVSLPKCHHFYESGLTTVPALIMVKTNSKQTLAKLAASTRRPQFWSSIFTPCDANRAARGNHNTQAQMASVLFKML